MDLKNLETFLFFCCLCGFFFLLENKAKPKKRNMKSFKNESKLLGFFSLFRRKTLDVCTMALKSLRLLKMFAKKRLKILYRFNTSVHEPTTLRITGCVL